MHEMRHACGVIAARLSALAGDDRGVTAVEYAVVAGAIIAAVAGAFTALGGNLSTYLGALSF